MSGETRTSCIAISREQRMTVLDPYSHRILTVISRGSALGLQGTKIRFVCLCEDHRSPTELTYMSYHDAK